MFYLKIFVFSALVNSNMAEDICKEEAVPRRDFSTVWIVTLLGPFLYLRAIQGHSGGEHSNPALQDNVLLPSDFAEYIHHVGSSHDMHSIQSGLIPGGKDIKKGRQTVFFTAVNPMFAHLHKQRDYDVTKPRDAVYKQN